MIVEKDFGSAFFLDCMMAHVGTPTPHGFLIPPPRKRQNPALARQALVSNIVHKTVDLLQFWPQHLGVGEIGIPLLRLGVHFKDHREHDGLRYRSSLTAAMQSISISKCPGHAGTFTKMRAGGSFGKNRV